MLPIVYTLLVDTKVATLTDFENWFTYNPIKIFNLEERKLEEGYIADLTILDIQNLREYKEEEILSMGKNSPYIGMKFKGFPILTIVNGKIIWRE